MYTTIILGVLIVVCSTANAHRGRIYNGFETTIDKFPHQAQLVRGTSHHCGATIVARPGDTYTYYAITAAHCVGSDPNPFRIKVGVTDRTQPGTLSQVTAIHVYPTFEWQNFQGDIAVLVLKDPIYFNDITKPAFLPDHNEAVPANAVAFASGWGGTEEGKGSINLRAAQLNVFSRERCGQIYSAKRYTEKNLCAGGLDTPKDSCGGDSGGPLVSDGKLIGVVSWGYGCGNPEYPGVYSNVAYFRDWLDTIIRF